MNIVDPIPLIKYNEPDDLISLSDFNDTICNSIDKFYEYSTKNRIEIRISNDTDILNFISKYIKTILLEEHKYKNINKKHHLFELYNIFNINDNLKYEEGLYFDFIMIICKSIGCQDIIKYSNLDIFTEQKLETFVFTSVEYGCYPIFIYLYEYISKKYSLANDFNERCFYASLSNSDDRVYKLLVSKIVNNTTPISYLCKEKIIYGIFRKHIPSKYILRRLKYISSIIDLSDKINDLLNATQVHDYSFELVPKILKYYYKTSGLDIGSYYAMVMCTLEHPTVQYARTICFYNELKSNIEKNTFVLSLLDHGDIYELNLINTHIPTNIPSIENYQLNNLIAKGIVKKRYDILHCIFSIYSYDSISQLLSKFNYCSSRIILPFIKYYNPKYTEYNTLETIVKFNKCLLHLRLYIRRVKKLNLISKKLFLAPVLRELSNLKPSCKPVFMNGTSFFINKKQCFNTIPPSSIFPGQLQLLKNSTYLLKNKADGILVYNIPSNTYPITINNKLKAEYIENLDLYLVFDINIEMSIEDRYTYLRELHPSTKHIKHPTITTIEEYYRLVEKENKLFSDFLLEPYTTYRWYPKAAWKIGCHNNMIEFYNNLLNGCKYEDADEIVPSDGMIITPLNGDRELKLKPGNLMTIDLLYKNHKWIDRDGYCYNDIIKNNNEIELSESIWRCYPDKLMYEPREIRHDKIKPNPRNVVSCILSLANIEFKSSYPYIYRTNQVVNTIEWKKIVSINNNTIKEMIVDLPCKHILDLGCGNGKSIQFLKDFKSYHGIDMDVNMLARGITNHSIENITFNNLDLSIDWHQPGVMWNNTIQDIKYDTVIAINSLQHFSTDIFWEQLNRITTSNTKMLFNLVSMENNYRFEFENNSYIERKDDSIHYMFTSIHKEPMKEPYINSIEKHGWKIIKQYKPDTSLLPSNYTWYIAIRV